MKKIMVNQRNKEENQLDSVTLKKLKRETKGITLIALVVTIIVLLILAGVAISLTIGQNGIINRAKDAVEIYEEAGIREKEGLNDLAGEIDKHANAGISNDKNRYQDMINKYTNLQELLYTARSGLSDIFSKLQNIRMELLEVKQSNDENGEHQNAVNQYLSEIDNVANTVSYDNIYLLNGFLETPFVEEIDDYNWTLQIDGCKTADLGINNLNVSDENNIQKIEETISQINLLRSYCGAKLSQVELLVEIYSAANDIINQNYDLEKTKQEIAKQTLNQFINIFASEKQLIEQVESGMMTDDDIENFQEEANALLEVIDIIANNIKINSEHILNGDFAQVSNVNLNALGKNGEKLEVKLDSTENRNTSLSNIEDAEVIINGIIGSL